MAAASGSYACETRTETLEWIEAIVDFLKPYSFLMNAHVVNFVTDRLWEAVDKDWIDCLRNEPPENLLLIPSGFVQDYWPPSLKRFIHTSKSLSFPRLEVDLQRVLKDLEMRSLNNVLSQGMNSKKKHEVEVLSAVVSSVVDSVGAQTVIDVGAGQGYLAQVLSFEYQHSVVAIDASSHHGKITDARAARIKKHYAAQMRKSGSGNKIPEAPMTITCRVLSTEMLKALSDGSTQTADIKRTVTECNKDQRRPQRFADGKSLDSLVLAGLHACGDLSVTMLRTFLECPEVEAVVSVGCCYNLLSEEGLENSDSCCGFPLSTSLKSSGFSLGKSSRDLACQSAERWSRLGKGAGLHNFELHAFRAIFQTVLSEYYPEVMATSPSIGRQGKAFRRQQQRKIFELQQCQSKSSGLSLPADTLKLNKFLSTAELPAAKKDEAVGSATNMDDDLSHGTRRIKTVSTPESDDTSLLFEKFCHSAFSRLDLQAPEDVDLQKVWKEAEPLSELIGPYWSLRAALGPVLETLILLDRLLFLQEQGGSIEAVMLPIFDPALSPRNVAIIAKRVSATSAEG